MRIDQPLYKANVVEARANLAKQMAPGSPLDELMKKAMPTTMGGTIPPKEWKLDHPLIKAVGRQLIKAGLTTATGFNFFDLRGPAYFLFPLLTPFIQSIPRMGRVNAGVGTAAHWKATRNPNSTFVYAGLLEGQRNAIATPNEVDYLATYKELGMDAGETFTAQFAGEGYTDNLADEHFRNLARLRLQEEMMTLWGNSGTAAGNLGYALGQAPNVTAALAVGTGVLGTGANVVAAVVAITPFGMNPGGQAGYAAPPSVANGLTTNYLRQNADGTTTNVSCGLSAISNVAAIVTTNSTFQTVAVSVPAVKGAVGYAWFWGVNVAAATGNIKLGAITAWPSYTISAVATGTQLGNAAGLNVDNSFQATDFDGLGTYAFQNGFWTDMNGGSFTAAGNGQVKEIETDLQNLWNNYQAQPDEIWVSADVRASLESAIVYSSTGTNSYIFPYTRDEQGGLMGGFMVTAYKSKYSINPEGGAAIPVRLHPMFPQGTLFYNIKTNPYPHSRIPAVAAFLTQRDYYAIEWPIVTRQWTFGTYVQEVLAHYLPWVSAIRTGIGPFVPCYIAAVVFGESFFTGPRVNLVRKWLVNDWQKTGPFAKLVMALYSTYGERVAKRVEKSPLLKRVFRKVFDRALARAEAKYGAVKA
jgi:hypothetical protein